MTPQYANTFGIRKVSDKEGEIIEVTLDIAYRYMETATAATNKGVETVQAPAIEQVASVVMTRQTAVSLRDLLLRTLGDEI